MTTIERAYHCTEHAEFGGPKRCQTGAQIAPDVCVMVSGRFVPDGMVTDQEVEVATLALSRVLLISDPLNDEFPIIKDAVRAALMATRQDES